MSVLRARREHASELHELPTEGLSEQVERRAELRELLADVRELPEEQRAALLLAEAAGLSHAEVAQVLGCEVAEREGARVPRAQRLIERREARDDAVQRDPRAARHAEAARFAATSFATTCATARDAAHTARRSAASASCSRRRSRSSPALAQVERHGRGGLTGGAAGGASAGGAALGSAAVAKVAMVGVLAGGSVVAGEVAIERAQQDAAQVAPARGRPRRGAAPRRLIRPVETGERTAS